MTQIETIQEHNKQRAITHIYMLGLVTALFQIGLNEVYREGEPLGLTPYVGILTATLGILTNQVWSFKIASWVLITHLMVTGLLATLFLGFATPLPLLVLLSGIAVLALLPVHQIKPTLIIASLLFIIGLILAPLPESMFGPSDERLRIFLGRPGAHLFNASIICYVTAGAAILAWNVESNCQNLMAALAEDLKERFKTIQAQQLKTTSIYRHIPRAILLLNENNVVVSVSLLLLSRAKLTEEEIIGRHIDDILQTPSGAKFEPFIKTKSLVTFRIKPDQKPALASAKSAFLLGKLVQTVIDIEFPRGSDSGTSPEQNMPQIEFDMGRSRLLFDTILSRAHSIPTPSWVIRLIPVITTTNPKLQRDLEGTILDRIRKLKDLPVSAVLRVAPEIFALIPKNQTQNPSVIIDKLEQALLREPALSDTNHEKLEFKLEVFRTSTDFKTAQEFCHASKQVSAPDIDAGLRERFLSHLREREFFFQFQAVHNLQNSKEILLVEGLPRWGGPDPLPPEHFIKLAKELGVSTRMTKLLFDQFCAALRTLDRRSECQIFASFNLEASELLEPSIREHIKTQVRTKGLDPRRIIVELAKTDTINSLPVFLESLTELSDFGFNIAIDNFGGTDASIEHLMQIPFQYLKLDKALTNGCSSVDTQQILASVARIGEELNVFVIATGIETQAQRECLQSLGVTWGQGFILSRPADPIISSEQVRANTHD
jgi:EAL domain-containing protein (putative c-di-GMP-specific phosphodiesterase class I)